MIDIIISMLLSSLMSVFIPLWVVQTNNNIKNNNNDYVMMYLWNCDVITPWILWFIAPLNIKVLLQVTHLEFKAHYHNRLIKVTINI